jgi:hypothetical protein
MWLAGVIGTIAVATAAGLGRLRRIPAETRAQPERDEPGRVEQSGRAAFGLNELLRPTLQRELSLAAEHVHSIRCLLEIARQHQQPIPSAALTNLDLVSKHLAEMQRRIEDADGDSECPVSAFAYRPEIQAPLHRRPPSFGCHVSPFDRSTPCD